MTPNPAGAVPAAAPGWLARLRDSDVWYAFCRSPVAIVSTAKNVPAARAFIDFILSREGQGVAASQGMFPARPDVTAPQGFPALASIKMLAPDIKAIEQWRTA